MVPIPNVDEMPNEYREGIRLFNQREFFAAHEALEDAWRKSPPAQKLFLQGLTQVAVALHHYAKGNLPGAGSVLSRAQRNLSGYPEGYGGLDLAGLRRKIADWLDAITLRREPPETPRLRFADVRIAPSVDLISTPEPDTRAETVRSGTHMRVPMVDLRRQYARIREEVALAIERVCTSQRLVLGEEVAAFEQEAAEFVGAKFAVGCASGTDALWLALAAAGIQPGDSVITTPFTFVATATSIVRAGARPVFVDIDPETYNLSPAMLEQHIGQLAPGSLRGLMPVHLYGQCADLDRLGPIAAEHQAVIVEDAAQAFGATWRGRRAGSLGSAAGFSFYPSKNLSAFGDGGCVTTSDPAMAERVRRLGNHGSAERYYHDELGCNSRLDSLQAAVLRVKLRYLPQWNEERRLHAAAYDRMFAEAGLAGTARTPVRLPRIGSQAYHVFHQYVIRVERRDELRAFLRARGIGSEIYYPVPLHLQKCFSYLGYRRGDFPEAELAASQTLALPMFAELTEAEQKLVVQTIAEFYS